MPDIVIPAPWWVNALVAVVGLALFAWWREVWFLVVLAWELARNMVRERQVRRARRRKEQLRARALEYEAAEQQAAHIARVEARRRAGWGTD